MKRIKLVLLLALFSSTGLWAQTEISDTDGDTKVETERFADDDVIRFTVGGVDRWKMEGRSIEPIGTGRSIFIGRLAGQNEDLTNNQNIFIGEEAGQFSTSADRNVAIGRRALYNNTTGSFNFAMGTRALINNNGDYNTAIGTNALSENTTGYRNISIGPGALAFTTEGFRNTAIGSDAMYNNTVGSYNTALGSLAGYQSAGNQNTFIGYGAGHNGDYAGNVMIGFFAGNGSTESNRLYIDNSSTPDPLLYGEFDNDRLTVNGKLTIDADEEIDYYDTYPFMNFRIEQANANGGIRFNDNGANTGYVVYDGVNDLVRLNNSASFSRNDLAISDAGNTALGGVPMAGARLYVNGDELVSGSLAVDTSGSQTFFVDASSNRVGIGTTSPANKLHVSGDDFRLDDTYAFVLANATISGGNSGFNFRNENASQAYIWHQGATGDLNIDNTPGGGGDHLVVKSDGKIGVNTDDPTGQLHVESSGLPFADATIFAEETSTDATTRVAVRGKATSSTTDGRGYGGYFEGGYIGLRGDALAETYSSFAYGVYGRSTGSAGSRIGTYGLATGTGTGNRYGLYGFASGGDRAYALFASGDAKVTSQLFIGTSTTDEDNASTFELLVDGEAICEELKVELSGSWPDYVFENDYDLPTLTEVKAHIDEHKHLPGVPSQATIQEEGGFFIGNMHQVQMKKIEELTLYAIDADEKIESLQNENDLLKKALENITSRLEALEK